MRVVYYVNGWPPGRFANGIVSAVGALAPALRDLGHDVTILAHRVADDYRDPAVFVLDEKVPWKPGLRPLRALRHRLSPGRDFYDTRQRLAKALTSIPHDVFEIEESFGWSAFVARRTPSAVVTRLHGPWFISAAALKGADALDAADRHRIHLEGRAIAAAAAITAPSRYVLDRVRSHYALELPEAQVIPNAVPPVAEGEAWRPALADANELLFVGRFDRLKGADTALRAFAMAAAARPGLRLTFVGPNSGAIEEDRRSRDCAQFVADELPAEIASRVSFVGQIPHSDIAPLRRRAFLTLVGSRDENFPGTLLEAIAAGSPVVATSVGGIPEIVRHDEEGLLVPPANPPAMAAAIAALLDNPAHAARLGENARRRALAEYAPQSVARRAADHYAEVSMRCRKAS